MQAGSLGFSEDRNFMSQVHGELGREAERSSSYFDQGVVKI